MQSNEWWHHIAIAKGMRPATAPALLVAAVLAVAPLSRGASAWISRDTPSSSVSFQHQQQVPPLQLPPLSASSDNAADTSTSSWAKRALLISSFSDGVVNSPPAKAFLKFSIATALATEQSLRVEEMVRESVLFSPCAGPSIDLLNSLEDVDAAAASLSSSSILEAESDTPINLSEMERRADDVLCQLSNHTSSDKDTKNEPTNCCRILYIPTAMYALNPESKNTPGKQRQRARADGKKRRNLVVKTIEDLLGDHVTVLACTLDFDDGSIKQPVGSDDGSLFPKDGKEAFSSWKPHLIYVEGGNTFWLQYCIEKGDWTWADDLLTACTGKDAYAVYVGKSAGAIVAGSRVDTATWKGWDNPAVVPGKETYGDWNGYRGMSFMGPNQSIFPHYLEESWEVTVQEKTKQMIEEDGDDVTVYSLHEWEACCIDGEAGEVFVVSGEQEYY